MASRSTAWVDPNAIASAKSLEWIAKSLAKGLLQGKHKSQRLSSGFEFSQYRPYVQGDDLRLIDWKMFAKTDKYYIKESDVERDHDLHIIFDNSKSMDYEEAGWSKLLYGKLVSACVSYIISQQGDAFSWSSIDKHFHSSVGMHHWRNSIHSMYDLKTSDDTHDIKINPTNNKVYLWLTDLYHSIEHIKTITSRLKQKYTELIIFHIVGKREEQLDFPNNSTFIDLENDEVVQMNPTEYLKEYKPKYEAHIAACKEVFYSSGTIYHKAHINDSIPDTLKLFLDSYNRTIAV